jgi:hypothetical protein
MSDPSDAAYRYNMTIKMFGAEPEPAFETPEQQAAVWGRPWGCDNDVGRLHLVLMHRPGDEMNVVDPSKRIEEIGSFGDPEAGWYWQSDTVPPVSEMQAQHDGLVEALQNEGVEVAFLDGVGGGRLKSCYTRDSAVATPRRRSLAARSASTRKAAANWPKCSPPRVSSCCASISPATTCTSTAPSS